MAHVDYTKDGTTGWIRLNRPERLNALSYEMLSLIDDAIRQAESDPGVRAVVMTGEGRAFSAGTDLQELSGRSERGESIGRADSGAARGPDSNAPAPWTMTRITKPTIAAVNGAAVGLGAEFTLQCDLRIASEQARFGWVFVQRGLVPDTGAGTWLLQRAIGLQYAAELLFSGEIISAQRAKEIGLVLDVVPGDQLIEKAGELAARVSKGGPLATAETKRLLYQGSQRTAGEHLPDTSETLNRMFASDDFKEGVRAFLERREPAWTGK